MSATNNKTSLLVSSQLPDFVRQDHQLFVEFLEYYYKALEQDGEMLYVSKRFPELLDIDIIDADITFDRMEGDDYDLRETTDYHAILQKMYNAYIEYLPDDIVADKTLLVKHIKDFYRSRGSEKSIKFLLRILFDKESEVYLPKRDILKTSDGKWYVEKSLRVANVAVNNISNSIAHHNFANTSIRGATSNATAIVEKVISYYENNTLVTELKISNVIRDFENGEEVFSIFTEQGEDKFLSANTLAGIIVSTKIISGGTGYVAGTNIPLDSESGSGGIIKISKTTTGSLKSIGVVKAGAGFKANDQILVTGGGGSGALANVFSVDTSGAVHPNSYNIVSTLISLEANTALNNATFTNLNSTNANSAIVNAYSYWTFSNCGPLINCSLIIAGNNYASIPSLDIEANTIVRSLGILGRMEIVDGGLGYSTNDKIEFISSATTLSLGSGAKANVTNVAANGMITEVKFESIDGIELPGGTGYTKEALPLANVISTGGSGANVVVTALIGDGEELITNTDSIGKILQLQIVAGGIGYESAPTLNLTMMGDGTAQANCIIATGVYTYPGRFLNDDGMLSAYNFIEDRDYYQNYSYVVKVNESINKYRKAVSDLIHPVGGKLFGEYVLLDTTSLVIDSGLEYAAQTVYTFTSGTYAANTVMVSKANTSNITNSNGVFIQPTNPGTVSVNVTNVIINITGHGLSQNDAIYLEFTSGDTANITNGYYVVTGTANANTFFVEQSNTVNTSGVVSMDVV